MRIVFLLLLSVILLVADGDDYERESHIPKDLSFLKLDKKQKMLFKEYYKEYRKRLKILHKKEEILEKRLKELFLHSEFNKEDYYKALVKLKDQEAVLESEIFAFLHKLLNKKQRERFLKYIEEWEVE